MTAYQSQHKTPSVSECVPLCRATNAYGRFAQWWHHEPECPRSIQRMGTQPPNLTSIDLTSLTPHIETEGDETTINLTGAAA